MIRLFKIFAYFIAILFGLSIGFIIIFKSGFKDTCGYPLRFPQVRVIRPLFENENFLILNSIFSFQELIHKKHFKYENNLRTAYNSLPSDKNIEFENKYNKWIEKYPNHYLPYLTRANYYYSLGWDARGGEYTNKTPKENFEKMSKYFDKAVNDLQQALSINKELILAYQLLISISMADNYGKEREYLDRGLKYFPNSYTLRSLYIHSLKPRWGGSYEQMNQFADESQTVVNKNPKLKTLYADVIYDQIDNLKKLKNPLSKNILELFDRAKEYDQSENYHEKLGDFYYYDLKQYDRALIEYKKCLQFNLGGSTIRSKIAKSYARLEQYDHALRSIKMAKIINPYNSYIQDSVGYIYQWIVKKGYELRKKNKVNQSNRLYELAIAFDKKNPEAYYRLGYNYSTLQIDLVKAEHVLRQAVKIGPEYFPGYVQLDYTLFRQGRYSEILEIWSDYFKLQPNDPRAYLERSGTYWHMKKYKEAYKDAQKACELGNQEACQFMEKIRTKMTSARRS